MDEKPRVWPFAALFVVYLVLAAMLPAVEDEVYYWCWSKELQWSYYDHPPMTAALIGLSTAILGDTVFGFRFPACLASTFVVYVISRLTPAKPLIWGLVLSPLFTIFAVVITPDSPLIMFWAAYLWWLIELHRRLTPFSNKGSTSIDDRSTEPNCIPLRWWWLGGIILGCGVLSKYTMGLAVPTGFSSLLLARRRWREWLPGYVMHGIIAFIVASPILIYNIHEEFEPLLFQWQHVAEKVPSSWRSLGDFVGVQVLAFGTMPFFLLPWVCFHIRRLSHNPCLRVCACLYALPLAFFLYKSTQTRLEGNWALVSFISFWPLASDWYQSVRGSSVWRWSTAASFLPPVLSVTAIAVHLIWPISIVPVQADRIHRQIALNAAAHEIAERIRKIDEPLPVYTDTYQSTSLLRFQSLDARQIAGLSRPSHFTRPPRRLTDVSRAYVVTERPLPPEFCEGFPPPRLFATIPVDYRGKTDRVLHIWLYDKSQ